MSLEESRGESTTVGEEGAERESAFGRALTSDRRAAR